MMAINSKQKPDSTCTLLLFPLQKSACDETNIRACMDELKELADSDDNNFYADIFIQLRHYLAKQDPGLLTDDDLQFKSPIKWVGQTNKEHGDRFHEDVWKARCLLIC